MTETKVRKYVIDATFSDIHAEQGEKGEAEQSSDSLLEEDLVVALLENYPEKEGFDPTNPLSPEELAGKSGFLMRIPDSDASQ